MYRATVKAVTVGTTGTLILAASSRWQFLVLRGSPVGHTVNVGTYRGVTTATGFRLPDVAGTGTERVSTPTTFTYWPPNTELWAIGGGSTDIIMVMATEIPWPTH